MWRSPESIVPTCDLHNSFLEERRASRPPSQVTVPFGSVLLRDPRTWHAGMPNPSSTDRIMIAVAYQAEWFTEDQRFKAPESARQLLTANPSVKPLCDFYQDEEWDKFSQVSATRLIRRRLVAGERRASATRLIRRRLVAGEREANPASLRSHSAGAWGRKWNLPTHLTRKGGRPSVLWRRRPRFSTSSQTSMPRAETAREAEGMCFSAI